MRASSIFSLFQFHLFLSVCMCVVGFMCYYGHVENTSNLGEDVVQSFFFGAAVEIPGEKK